VSSPTRTPSDHPTGLLKERVRRVFRHLPKALVGDEEGLHQLRVMGRRLRVALPLLARKPEGKRVRRALRTLRQMTRTAGASRDFDVMAVSLDQYIKQSGEGSPEMKLLRRRLLDARRRSHGRMAEGMLDLEIAALRRDLRAVQERHAESLFTVLLRMRQARDANGDEVLAILHRLEDSYQPETLHLLRRRLRRLRYLAELQNAVRAQESEAPALFKQLQDGLGLVQDNFLLSSWMGVQAGRAAGRGEAALHAQASALAAHFLARSREHHAAVLALRPLDRVAEALSAMGRARGAA
jgi:CHAD domain-containing protein